MDEIGIIHLADTMKEITKDHNSYQSNNTTQQETPSSHDHIWGTPTDNLGQGPIHWILLRCKDYNSNVFKRVQ